MNNSQDPRPEKPKHLTGRIDEVLDLDMGPYLRVEGVGLIDMSLLPHDRKWYETQPVHNGPNELVVLPWPGIGPAAHSRQVK